MAEALVVTGGGTLFLHHSPSGRLTATRAEIRDKPSGGEPLTPRDVSSRETTTQESMMLVAKLPDCRLAPDGNSGSYPQVPEGKPTTGEPWGVLEGPLSHQRKMRTCS